MKMIKKKKLRYALLIFTIFKPLAIISYLLTMFIIMQKSFNPLDWNQDNRFLLVLNILLGLVCSIVLADWLTDTEDKNKITN